MLNNCLIAVPSKSRGGDVYFKTLDSIPFPLRQRSVLVLSSNDEGLNAYDYPQFGDTWILDAPDISVTRQMIMERAYTEGCHWVIMLDDDLVFHKRDVPWIPDVMTPFTPPLQTREELMAMFEHFWVKMLSTDSPQLSWCERQFNISRKKSSGWMGPTRAVCAYANNVDFFHNHDIRYDRVVVMEDYDATLQLLELGYLSETCLEYVFNNEPGVRGGCSVYRDNDLQAKYARALAELHPDSVEVVVKKSGMSRKAGDERVDARIRWAGAYREDLRPH